VGNIAAIRAWAEEQNATNMAFARMCRDVGGPFPERLASIVLVGPFLVDLADTVADWADWAQAGDAQSHPWARSYASPAAVVVMSMPNVSLKAR
jgi:hypothetical protein